MKDAEGPQPEASEAEEDGRLMIALAQGDDLALNQLMARWGGRIAGYLERLSGDAEAARDLTQETFVRVYRYRWSFDPACRFSTWLYTIATRLAHNHARSRQRRPLVHLDDEALQHLAGAASEPAPAEVLERKERAAMVREAVLALPSELREPLILSVYEHLSHVQVGTILDISEKAVETRLYRARRILREVLESRIGHAARPHHAESSQVRHLSHAEDGVTRKGALCWLLSLLQALEPWALACF